MKIFSNAKGYTSDQIYAADVNNDERVNAEDASRIYDIYNKSIAAKGEANCDGTVNMSDTVLIMQSLANPSKYGVNGTDLNHITEQGIKNGDMDGNRLTNSDALEIQRMSLGL